MNHLYCTYFGQFAINGRIAERISREYEKALGWRIGGPSEMGAPKHVPEIDFSPLVQRYFSKIRAHTRRRSEAV